MELMETICDSYCRWPLECRSSEELEENHCNDCVLIQALNLGLLTSEVHAEPRPRRDGVAGRNGSPTKSPARDEKTGRGSLKRIWHGMAYRTTCTGIPRPGGRFNSVF